MLPRVTQLGTATQELASSLAGTVQLGQPDTESKLCFPPEQPPACPEGTASLWFEKVEVPDPASVRKVPPISSLWPHLKINSNHFSSSDQGGMMAMNFSILFCRRT